MAKHSTEDGATTAPAAKTKKSEAGKTKTGKTKSGKSLRKPDSRALSTLPKSPTLEEEYRVGYPSLLVAGVDEVGRGCIAGPVVAGAVVLPGLIDYKSDPWLLEVTDSKLLVASDRERLAPLIIAWALSSAIGLATVEEIDKINIFHASHLAMTRAVQSLPVRPQHLLIDGKFLPKTGLIAPASAIIKGDLKCLSIACASIIAKVWRDHLMFALDQEYPGYGLAQHKGYPTPEHARALQKNGILKIHRKSFRTIGDTVV